MTAVLRVARGELRVLLRAPILYAVGGLFLVVQGVAFAALVGEMADLRRPAPLGALLEGQLAGTLLTWVLELVVLALLGMRSIADDKRTGGWELLLTSQVSERAAVVGKWVAACCVYATLWLPTLAYFGVVAVFRPADAGGWDLGAIACGYAGAIAIGVALLAWAIAASAAATTSLAAAAIAFALLVGWFLVGEVGSLWPSLAVDHPAIADALARLSLRAIAADFARGDVDVAALVRLAAIAVTGLAVAVALACAGRRRHRELAMRWIGCALIAVIGVAASWLAVRHPCSWDVSSSRRSSLDPQTVEVVAALPAPATITIVEPTLGGLEPVYVEAERVARRIARAAPADAPIEIVRADPATVAGGMAAIAREAGVAERDLASNGAIIVDVGGRRRVVDRTQIATLEDTAATGGADAGPRLRVDVERALANALAELSAKAPLTVCATAGHGELAMTAAGGDADWKLVAARLRAMGADIVTVEPGELATAVPARCTVVIVAGPSTPLSPEHALALQAYVARGGGLLVAAAARPAPTGGLAPTGLEGMLAPLGLGLPPAIAVDPALAVRELPGAVLVFGGGAGSYAAHPIDAGFAGARATLWYPPRAVVALPELAEPLVATTPGGWGERDLQTSPAVKDADDLAGPVALAAASKHARVVAIGSAESMSTAVLAGGASAGDLWVAQAVRWLAGQSAPALAIAAHGPDDERLVMTDGQRRAVIAACVGGIPLAWLAIGGALVGWRRRRVA